MVKAEIQVVISIKQGYMRVLLFSYLPVNVTCSKSDSRYMGGNWVSSLIHILSKDSSMEIGVAFITSAKSQKNIRENICYYPIYYRNSWIKKVLLHITRTYEHIQREEEVNSIIEDFRPDIIQLFGIETSFGSILRKVTSIPVVVHLQGIVSSYYYYYYPRGMSGMKLWWYSPLKNKLRFNTPFDLYKRLIFLSKIERDNFKSYKYYLGRTEWDYRLCNMLSRGCNYYNCDEVLRPEFYDSVWHPKQFSHVIISTIMNGELYKGFDTILITANILKENGFDFEWNVYGVDESFLARKALEKYYCLRFSECCVHFKGKTYANELVEKLLDTTYYVHPSHIDNSPNSLCEAMILGVPSIAMYVGGVPSLIQNGITGWLVPDADYYQLAYIIMKYYKDFDTIKNISENSRISALKHHNPYRIVNQLKSAYENILSHEKL